MLIAPDRVIERVRARVTAGRGGCHISTYSTNSNGYAQVGWCDGGRTIMTVCHRIAWQGEHGPIPDGMTVDHLCKTRRCVRPDHLRILSNFENARRTKGRDWPLGLCANGHPNDLLEWAIHGPSGERRRVCPPCIVTSRTRALYEMTGEGVDQF